MPSLAHTEIYSKPLSLNHHTTLWCLPKTAVHHTIYIPFIQPNRGVRRRGEQYMIHLLWRKAAEQFWLVCLRNVIMRNQRGNGIICLLGTSSVSVRLLSPCWRLSSLSTAPRLFISLGLAVSNKPCSGECPLCALMAQELIIIHFAFIQRSHLPSGGEGKH